MEAGKTGELLVSLRSQIFFLSRFYRSSDRKVAQLELARHLTEILRKILFKKKLFKVFNQPPSRQSCQSSVKLIFKKYILYGTSMESF